MESYHQGAQWAVGQPKRSTLAGRLWEGLACFPRRRRCPTRIPRRRVPAMDGQAKGRGSESNPRPDHPGRCRLPAWADPGGGQAMEGALPRLGHGGLRNHRLHGFRTSRRPAPVKRYIDHYNHERPHQSLDYRAPHQSSLHTNPASINNHQTYLTIV